MTEDTITFSAEYTPEISPEVQELLARVMEWCNDTKAQAWPHYEKQAMVSVAELVRQGEVRLSKSGELREQYARKLALEDTVEFAANEGFSMDEITELSQATFGADFARVARGTPPRREQIDDLRFRVALILAARHAEEVPQGAEEPQRIDVA